ncbi:MAG: hypothetical protein WC494_00950 [Candidatus Pacearchaeota archaeon]
MESFILINNGKRGQAWGVDLIIAMIIISIGIIFFLLYSSNNFISSKESYEIIYYEGKSISDKILSEGYPKNWNSSNVVSIGLTTNNKIDQDKLEEFYEMSQKDYPRTKKIFGTKYDYYFSVEGNLTVNSTEIQGFGKPGVNITEINPKNLIKINRISIYKNKLVKISVYIWGQ